jgi:hypothetical protein
MYASLTLAQHVPRKRGDLTLRKSICERVLPTHGMEAVPEQVIVVPGSQYGAMLIALTLQQSRSVLHFGVPGYLGVPRNFVRFGYELHGHAVDADGIRLGAARLDGIRDARASLPAMHQPQRRAARRGAIRPTTRGPSRLSSSVSARCRSRRSGPRRASCGAQTPASRTYFSSTNSAMPWCEPSRPMPDCLTPPNGATSTPSNAVLTPTMPHSSASATLTTRRRSRA